MLDNLKDNLRGAIQKIVKSSGIDEELIKELSKDVQRALLQSDVNVRLVLEITKNLEERSINETPPPGLSRKDHIVKILYDELSKLLGNETEFNFFSTWKAKQSNPSWNSRKWKNNCSIKTCKVSDKTRILGRRYRCRYLPTWSIGSITNNV
jgi:signal recognition particle GTPase